MPSSTTLSLLLSASLAIAGCASPPAAPPVMPPTEDGSTVVVIRLAADADVAAIADRAHVEVTGEDGSFRVYDVPFRAGEPGAMSFPAMIEIEFPDAREGDAFEVVAEVLDTARAVAARQRARADVAVGARWTLELPFVADCVLELCGADTTCRDGACVGACLATSATGAVTPVDCSEAADDPTSCDDEHADAIFCDGFESGGVERWTDEGGSPDRQLAVVDDPVHRGTHALHASTTETVEVSSYARARVAVSAADDLNVRFWAYVPSGQTFETTNLLFAGGSDAAGFFGLVVGLDGDDAYARWHPATEGPTLAFPRDRWVCVRARAMVGAGTAGAIELSVAESTTRSEGRDVAMRTPEISVNVGIARAPTAAGPLDVYVDDVVIDAAPLSCD